jgi:hypothetical protein
MSTLGQKQTSAMVREGADGLRFTRPLLRRRESYMTRADGFAV